MQAQIRLTLVMPQPELSGPICGMARDVAEKSKEKKRKNGGIRVFWRDLVNTSES